jgi:Zn-dependent M28 family amino/carboxypeptidase
VPGANDGASGVAVLLELARVLPHDLEGQIWLVMFDAEDNGHLEGWDWILGSSAFAESLAEVPDGVVVVDMIGDADLQIYLEINSDKSLRTDIWEQAASLGHADVFINEEKFSMLDDHSPFLRLGIPAVDIIDFDYPYWHTLSDTPNKVSADSLQIVGETLLAWLLSR